MNVLSAAPFILTLLAFEVSGRAVNISSSWFLPQENFPVFYRYFRDKVTWNEADAICEFHHGDLVTVETSSQMDAARAYLKELDIVDHVWIGLVRETSEKPFTWMNGEKMYGDGFWLEPVPKSNEQLCAAMDPAADFRWSSFHCGGPQTASFICELPVPEWAMKDDGCMVTSLPSLTVTLVPELGVIELISDCGLDGTRRIACKGGVVHEDMIKRLSCDRADESSSSSSGSTMFTSRSTPAVSRETKETTQSTPGVTKGWSWDAYEPQTRHRRDTNPSSPSTPQTTDPEDSVSSDLTILVLNASDTVTAPEYTLRDLVVEVIIPYTTDSPVQPLEKYQDGQSMETESPQTKTTLHVTSQSATYEPSSTSSAPSDESYIIITGEAVNQSLIILDSMVEMKPQENTTLTVSKTDMSATAEKISTTASPESPTAVTDKVSTSTETELTTRNPPELEQQKQLEISTDKTDTSTEKTSTDKTDTSTEKTLVSTETDITTTTAKPVTEGDVTATSIEDDKTTEKIVTTENQAVSDNPGIVVVINEKEETNYSDPYIVSLTDDIIINSPSMSPVEVIDVDVVEFPTPSSFERLQRVDTENLDTAPPSKEAELPIKEIGTMSSVNIVSNETGQAGRGEELELTNETEDSAPIVSLAISIGTADNGLLTMEAQDPVSSSAEAENQADVAVAHVAPAAPDAPEAPAALVQEDKAENVGELEEEKGEDPDDMPQRPNRGRLLTHSNHLSFYPYFLNRVLG